MVPQIAYPTCKVEGILKMLEETKAQIKLSKNRDVILLLGDTGAGKSTLAHFIGKDNKKLISIKESAGQFLLVDDEKKISKQTTISETIIPQLVEDINSNTTLYDCPGFHDTRNTATDIVNAFSIHTIMEHANQFKIIFVLNYHSVKCGIERRSFIELMKNASKIIKNIQNYEKSIAAVITKVDNLTEKRDNVYVLISDNEILYGIEKFLRKVKEEISEQKSYYNTAIKLINIFLEKHDGNYKRLAIFRRPDEEGCINDNVLLQTEKITIQKMFHQNIIYTRKSEMDFGYTISDESKNDIFYLVDEINNNITKAMISIGNDIIKKYKEFEIEHNNLNTKIDKFNQAHLEFINLKVEIEKNANLSKIIKLIKQILSDLNIQIPEDYFNTILIYEYNLKFLSKVSERPLLPKSIEIINGIEHLLKYLLDSKDWYIFLSALYAKLTEYDIQKDPSKLNINDLQSLYMSWIRQKAEKIGSDFHTLFQHIYSTDIGNGELIRHYSSIENIKIDEIKLGKLLQILVYALESDVKFMKIGSTKIRIVGKFITFTKILNKILPSNITCIEIFAANKIFIDENINFVGQKRKIFIATPELDIINTKNIYLDGADAVRYAELQAKDGAEGKDGTNGLPGLPGGIAGTFFGVAYQCFNSESLTITANGGKGSDGQNGGRGGKGSDGEDPKLPNMEWFTGRGATGEDVLRSGPFKYRNLSALNEPTILEAAGSVVNNVQGVGEKVITGKFDVLSLDSLKKSFHSFGESIIDAPNRLIEVGQDISKLNISNIKALLHVWDETRFEIYGKNGVKGYKGGNGGAGGLGGKSGKINLFTLKNMRQRLGYESNNGSVGNGGKGGAGGPGGKHGICLTAKFINYKTPMATKGVPMIPAQVASIGVDLILPSSWSEESRKSRGSADSGEAGIDSGNKIGQKEPEKDEIKIDSLGDILNEYIEYLKKNTVNSIKKESLLDFIEKLMCNMDITNVY